MSAVDGSDIHEGLVEDSTDARKYACIVIRMAMATDSREQ